MADRGPKTLFNESLRNLRKIWRDVLPQSWRGGERVLEPSLTDDDLEHLRGRMRECLEARGGEVSARARAADLGNAYLQLDATGRGRFLDLLANAFGVDDPVLAEAIAAYQQAPAEARAEAEDQLRQALISPRIRLLTQFNDLPDGTKFLVDLRADLLPLARAGGALRALDREIERLLGAWFDPGFLELRRIDWHSSASLLEKLIAYEAVHEIESWDDLRNRLETDRCCYAFFHHHMPGEPLIFVEVALVNGIAGDIQQLLDEEAPELDPREADTAIFYSISNTQRGLRGISFGNFLIKRVVDDLRSRFPKLNQFVTLSPIPGFGRWLAALPEDGLLDLLGAGEREQIQEITGTVSPAALQEYLAEQPWTADRALAGRIQAPLMKLGAHYLAREKRGQGPLDPVASFHLGNGARIERLNWLGNDSLPGRAQSGGMMVNYAYRLGEIEQNHERFATDGEIAYSPELKKLLKK